MKNFISKLKGQIIDDPLSSVLILTLSLIAFIFAFLGSIAVLVKIFMVLFCDVPTLKIL